MVCDECGRHQFNSKARIRGVDSPIPGSIPHVVVDELADTVVVCKGCGHPFGGYL